MAPDRSLIILTMAGAAVLAAFGAVPAAFDTNQGLRADDWLLATTVVLAAVSALLSHPALALEARSAGHVRRNGPPFWCWAVSALSMAALSPLATESTRAAPLPSLAFAAVALAAAIACHDVGARATFGTTAATGLACLCGITGILWPLGYAWAALARRHPIRRAILLLIVGAIAIFAGRRIGWPPLAAGRTVVSIHAVDRDVAILLPVFLLGLVGYWKGSRGVRLVPGDGKVPWLAGWTGVSLIGLALALAGAPLDVRMCMLPFWWWMPAGLQQLLDTITLSKDRAGVLRRIGWLSCLLVAGCGIAGVHEWLNGPLLALYLLTNAR